MLKQFDNLIEEAKDEVRPFVSSFVRVRLFFMTCHQI